MSCINQNSPFFSPPPFSNCSSCHLNTAITCLSWTRDTKKKMFVCFLRSTRLNPPPAPGVVFGFVLVSLQHTCNIPWLEVRGYSDRGQTVLLSGIIPPRGPHRSLWIGICIYIYCTVILKTATCQVIDSRDSVGAGDKISKIYQNIHSLTHSSLPLTVQLSFRFVEDINTTH